MSLKNYPSKVEQTARKIFDQCFDYLVFPSSENPTAVKTLETPFTRDVAPRHALGDLSNTTRKPVPNKQVKHESGKP